METVYKPNNNSHVRNQEKEPSYIHQQHLQISQEMIVLQSPFPLKCISSGVTGAGLGWYQTFVNRHVNKNYNYADHQQEMAQFLKGKGLIPDEAVGMMTAVNLRHVAVEEWKEKGFSLLIVVTAGVGNAVDATLGSTHMSQEKPGTINSWIFVNGKLTDEAFIQSIVTATEVKTKVLREANVLDEKNNTLATGTSTDSILVAASQQGRQLEFAGPISELGILIGKGVFSCTKKALEQSRRDR